MKLCIVCGKFNRQVMESQDMCRCYKKHEAETPSDQAIKLDEDKKAELKQLLSEQSEKRS
ncbi:hypothetical protein [Coraliomargarita parva]|uniref:hypothetical protein n=1 Tax=Coraliomargarita parva TaxID=3014050 RepID=UPI0022B5D32B|nr:hypothetical protein [Coraliomargarita parva]